MRPPSVDGLFPGLVPWGLAIAFALAITLFLVARAVQSAFRRYAARARARRASEGEARAAILLEDEGYRILAVQARGDYALLVDGEPRSFELRADYLVGRDGRRFVAEVKTGRLAPSLATSATRRQLLEYKVAFQTDGVLLVDVDASRVLAIEFPLPSARASTSFGWGVFGGVALTIALALAAWSLR